MEQISSAALPLIRELYARFDSCHAAIRSRLGRGLTLSEKILFAHWIEGPGGLPERGKRTEHFRPDRIAMQDATAQMAILQFISAGLPRVQAPTTVHCDHLILAKNEGRADLAAALESNREVYSFLRSAAEKFGMGFWEPGAGIIHQVVLENYAFPGGLIIGTDSHTPNAGGLGMLACGVGGADAVDVMVGLPWEVLWPRLVGVRLTGAPSGWTSGKDVILKLAGLLSVKGGTGRIIEYFGPGCAALSATAKATITNMGAELGATTSVFPFDERMAVYLRATGREELAALAERHAAALRADDETLADPKRHYDELVEIDLSTLEPHVVGPFTPDLARPISALAVETREKGWPARISVSLIGSCTNSSYEDIGRAAHVARQATARGAKAVMPLYVTPGSEQVRATIERDGLWADLEKAGAILLANACGPCIGQWDRSDVKQGEANSIMTSYNRNFPKRNDGNAATAAFIASPEIVMAYALGGTLLENPIAEGVTLPDGSRLALIPPAAEELPARGFATGAESGYLAPSADGSAISLAVSPTSERLAVLEPFPVVPEVCYRDLPILMKAAGKCTTDHISPAGPWLRFRGHLDRISDNLFNGANNAFTVPPKSAIHGAGGTACHPGAATPGTGVNVFDGSSAKLSALAREYKAAGLGWVAIGDENYGEGSSREHAAMSPRHLGCLAVIVRGFARIHETNLKKQGILPLVFANPADYDRIEARDRVSVPSPMTLEPGRDVTVTIARPDGSRFEIICRHSLNAEQISWLRAGSALNLIGARFREKR
jgi:aconitate hydratase